MYRLNVHNVEHNQQGIDDPCQRTGRDSAIARIKALLRGPAVFGGVVAEPRPFRDLGLVVHVRVAALLDRRATGDEKSGVETSRSLSHGDAVMHMFSRQ